MFDLVAWAGVVGADPHAHVVELLVDERARLPPARRPPNPADTPNRTNASPVLIPTRNRNGSPPTACNSEAPSTIRNPARTARSGSSSCATGAPNTPTTASPMNFSITPP